MCAKSAADNTSNQIENTPNQTLEAGYFLSVNIIYILFYGIFSPHSQ